MLLYLVLITEIKTEISQKSTITIDSIERWIDSTIVLCWFSQKPSHWFTFVANGILELQIEPELSWHQVIPEKNPADPASRGVESKFMKSCNIWWHGPKSLVSGNSPYPNPVFHTNEKTQKRQTLSVNTFVNTKLDREVIDLTKCKSFYKFFCIIAQMKTFISTKRQNKMFPIHSTVADLSDCAMMLRRQGQRKVFANKIERLQTSPQVISKSKIFNLGLFLYNGVFCVSGKLRRMQFFPMKQFVSD